jgi:hypothetical protein
MKLVRDLLFGPGNEHLELGRVLAALGGAMMAGAAGWNVSLGLPIDLGPTGLGGGLGAVFAGAAGLIWAKNRAQTESTK